jgi:hypothetical protein
MATWIFLFILVCLIILEMVEITPDRSLFILAAFCQIFGQTAGLKEKHPNQKKIVQKMLA